MRILYAGDSPVGGPANYLLGILRYLKARVSHVPPSQVLKPRLLHQSYDTVILSDFSHRNLPRPAEREIVNQVRDGTGFLMVGGWASFSGPFGGWRGSLVEEILPVNCGSGDDRVHCPGGAVIVPKRRHALSRLFYFTSLPLICGFNRFRAKKKSAVILGAKKILIHQSAGAYQLALEKTDYPLLVADSNPRKRIAALAADLAPHWCGGLVDWGKKRLRLRVEGGVAVEVGERYVEFVSLLIRWLTGH